MDISEIAELTYEICIAFLSVVFISMSLLIAWMILLDWIKKYKKKEFGEFFWIYLVRPYRLSIDLDRSTYLDYTITESDGHHYLGSVPTIDDPVMFDIAKKLSEMCEGRSEKWKANFLLAFVQQNVSYERGPDAPSYDRCWALPIQTLRTRKGDCKATAALYCGLAELMGIRVKLFIVKEHEIPTIKEPWINHAIPGIKEPSIKGRILDDGEGIWYPAETTSMLPFTGAYTLSKRVVRSADIVVPGGNFRYALIKKHR